MQRDVDARGCDHDQRKGHQQANQATAPRAAVLAGQTAFRRLGHAVVRPRCRGAWPTELAAGRPEAVGAS